jgi:tetratricopeptide (TPR) repeat protein
VFSLSASWDIEQRYLDQGNAAFQAKDYPLALTCFERACTQGGLRPTTTYQLALTAEALALNDRAVLLMNRLAPADAQGYGEAHLWQAVRLLQNSPQTDADRKKAERHLLYALQGETKDKELAHVLLGEVYFAEGKLDLAEPHLAKALKARPVTRLRLARLYALRGDRERARREAVIAADYFQARTKLDLTDHFARLAWADATAFLERFSDAAAILEEGWAVSQRVEYRIAQGMVYASWCDYQVRVKGGKDHDQLALVQKGLSYDPNNTLLLNRLLTVLTTGGDDVATARSALEKMLARGEAPGVVHFALGVDAWHRGQREQAQLHWERATELAPYLTLAANNLAMLLMEADPSQLPRALQLINLALDKTPASLNFRDTRGRIYAKMGKWREALADLEAALTRNADSPSLHRTLATVYDHLDVQTMAEEHRRQADQLSAKQKTKG